jgi:DNA-binding transcriptional regulator YiaG
MMAIDDQTLPELVKEIRRQLSLSQEDLARKLGISFATVNRWENGVVKPSKLAKAQLDNFCAKMTRQGKLELTGGDQ